jgi:hypothetical protein
MGIGKIKIDFQILDTKDPRVILVADNSYWRHIEDKPSIIEVTLPADTEPVVYNFKKNRINSFNSSNLMLNCTEGCEDVELIDLPDGIYIITLKGSPDTFNKTKKYFKSDKIELELDKIYINLRLECEKLNTEASDKIDKINLLLRATSAHVRFDNICKANETYQLAKEIMEELKNCRECVGAV